MEENYQKKYEKALKAARTQRETYLRLGNVSAAEVLAGVFPELNESKDEETRKAILEFFRLQDKNTTYSFVSRDDIIAWLENQNHDGKKWIHEDVYYKEKDEAYNDGMSEVLENPEKYGFIKRGEQPPAEWSEDAINQGVKISCDFFDTEETPEKEFEPKFINGQWITNGEYTWKVIDIKPLDYILQSQDGYTVCDTISYVDEEFHLWAVQDAKAGDVLNNGANIFIFSNLSGQRVMGYCYVNTDKGIFSDNRGSNDCFGTTDAKFLPANQEQRDLLFRKMAEAGYEWDSCALELLAAEKAPHTEKYLKLMSRVCEYLTRYGNSLYNTHLDKANEVYRTIDDLHSLGWRATLEPTAGKEDEKQGSAPCGAMKPTTKEELEALIEERIKNDGVNADLNDIDVSQITNMGELFLDSKFNGDISGWDVSNVKNMSRMFCNSEFNGDISKWDVSNVTDMEMMFYYSQFNGDISKWDVSNVEDMGGMFASSKFNGDISKWDVSKVKYMTSMFASSKFNSDISKWNVSNVTNMRSMFYQSEFNGDISKWDVSNVKNMSWMFMYSAFNGDTSKWDVSNVETMEWMLAGSVFNRDISGWNVSNVANMRSMFYKSEFNGDISKWSVGNVRNMEWMFGGSKFNGDISKWDVSNVKNMSYMFDGSPLEGNPPKWYKCKN